MTKHNLKALAVLLCVGLIIVVVQQGASLQLLPTWQELLIKPTSSWMGADEPEASESNEPITITQPVSGARPPAPAPPQRVANEPVEAPPPGEDAGEEPARETQSSPVVVEADPVSTGASGEAVPAAPAATVEDVLVRGGDLVEQGVELPQLWAAWTPALLIELTQRGYGDIVAQHAGRRYRLALEGAATLSEATFVAMTAERQGRLSNRGFPLNRRKHAGRWIDTPLRPAFAEQERLIRSLADAGAGDEVPVFTFYATSAFDRYLATKQLGAVAEITENRDGDSAGERGVATSGRIVLTPRRPYYVIENVVIDGENIHWRDPEAEQIRM